MRKKFLIGGAVLCLAVGYLGYVGFRGSATYFLEVNELMEQGSSIYDKSVRVNGDVVPESVHWDPKNLVLEFTIAGGGQSLPVIYKGIVPDTFQADSQVVVEGKINPEGVFEAYTIMTKCPSKYEPEQ